MCIKTDVAFLRYAINRTAISLHSEMPGKRSVSLHPRTDGVPETPVSILLQQLQFFGVIFSVGSSGCDDFVAHWMETVLYAQMF